MACRSPFVAQRGAPATAWTRLHQDSSLNRSCFVASQDKCNGRGTRRQEGFGVPRPTVAICRTCPRATARAPARGDNPDGMAVLLRSALLADRQLAGEIDIMMVHCLGACL